MATQVFSLFFLSLVIRASFSLIVPLDVKAVKLSDSVRESELTENSPAVLDHHPRPSEEAEFVQSLTLVDAVSLGLGDMTEHEKHGEHGRRVKRAFLLTLVKCAGDMFGYADKCLTKEQYDRVMKDYNEE